MSLKHLLQIVLVVALLVAWLSFPRSAAAWNCGSTYVVQRGDYLSKIASRCGVTLSALYTANPWTRYSRYIYPGQVLNIPGGPIPGPIPGPMPGPVHTYCGPSYSEYYGNYYVVCRGDTLGKIANYYGESWGYLQWRNHIANPNFIYAGQFIYP